MNNTCSDLAVSHPTFARWSAFNADFEKSKKSHWWSSRARGAPMSTNPRRPRALPYSILPKNSPSSLYSTVSHHNPSVSLRSDGGTFANTCSGTRKATSARGGRSRVFPALDWRILAESTARAILDRKVERACASISRAFGESAQW